MQSISTVFNARSICGELSADCLIIEQDGIPLPAGCHLIPEVVATWNRGKGPINVYSCFQKNYKSLHVLLGPVGAIWLRLIMTCVYNAYHAYTLSRTVGYP